jgi:hypothetical protein
MGVMKVCIRGALAKQLALQEQEQQERSRVLRHIKKLVYAPATHPATHPRRHPALNYFPVTYFPVKLTPCSQLLSSHLLSSQAHTSLNREHPVNDIRLAALLIIAVPLATI